LPPRIIPLIVAQSLFITGYIFIIKHKRFKILNRGFITGIMICFSYTVVIYLAFINGANTEFLIKAGSLTYSIMVSLMTAFVVALYSADKLFLLTAIGGVMFVISDRIIGIEYSYYPYVMGVLVLFTYLTALFGVIYAPQFIHKKRNDTTNARRRT
jgi:uncharacterized membrane protein